MLSLGPLNKLRNTFALNPTNEYSGHQSKILTLGWSSDGTKLASGSADKTSRVWKDIHRLGSNGVTSVELKGHTGDVDQLCWDPIHPEALVTASTDKSIRIWDLREAPYKSRQIVTSGENINVCWSPDGKTIAVGNKEDRISFIDPRGGSDGKNKYIWHDLHYDGVEINEISWNWAGDLFFMTTGKGRVKIVGFPSFELVHEIAAHTANCFCIEFDPKGRYFATGGADCIASIWDLQEFACMRSFTRLDWPVRAIGFSHDGELIATGSEDNMIDISSVESGELVHTLPCDAAVNSVAWHPSKHILAYAGDDQGPSNFKGNLRVFGALEAS
ncbi:hypothetical protein HK104_011283 [Borealophlyctis nickersoniae]|nr:hypothetical protein HK104_011283 [Borealophlyctis nickersoniae]